MIIRNSVRGLLFIPLLLACFALLPAAQAVTPAPDGGYAGFNTAEGQSALGSATPGVWNTAIGGFTLNVDISGGTGNTAVGLNALRANTLGDFNSALGVNALRFNDTGNNNTALGYQALFVNTGDSNTAVGFNALHSNTTAVQGVAVGQGALGSNTTGQGNVAVGYQALSSSALPGVNTFGGNVAIGFKAMGSTTGGGASGDSNTAIGDRALAANITGFENTAVGILALGNSTGVGNEAFGAFAGSGFTTASGSIAIGAAGANESGRTFVGNLTNSQIQSFNGTTIKYVTSQVSNGRLGVTAVVSSRRYKHDIKPMENVSDGILKLKPVTFHLNKEVDTNGFLGFGLIAEDVEDVNPDWVFHNPDGSPESVRYDEVWACLLNEFLKEHKTVEAQQASIADLKSTVALQRKEMEVLTAQLKEQAAQIQRVSAQIELNKPAPTTAANK